MRTRLYSVCGLAGLLAPQALRRMALVQTAAHVDAISGKMGNAVFSKSRNGATMRKRVVPHNPRTATQQSARSHLSSASKAFSALTSTQRSAWDAYASGQTLTNRLTGGKSSPSAIAAFTKLSAKFEQINPGSAIPLSPPSSPFAGDTVTVTATGGVGAATITASAANATNAMIEVLAVKVQSANRRPAITAYRHKAFFTAAAGSLTLSVPLAKGVWFLAYSIVDSLTGEKTLDLVMGSVVIS